jgi:hypothetical protein
MCIGSISSLGAKVDPALAGAETRGCFADLNTVLTTKLLLKYISPRHPE